MSTRIRLKRSSVPGKIPLPGQLKNAEVAYNTYDGELYGKRERVGIGTDIVRIGSGATVTNILYVTEDGKDENTGKKLGDAKATIKGAIAAATTGTVIKVSAGSYIEDNPLIIPEQVSIVGDSLREVSVSPLNANQDLFYVSNGNYVAEMSYTGSLNSGKAIFAFNSEQIGYFDQSPYIQNCTNFIPNSIGLKIDGNNAIGPLKSMVLDSYTQYNQGGIGVSITNEGYAQLVSLFTICCDVAVYCGSGAACDLTNSNSSFGNYALVANGTSPKKYSGIITQNSLENDDTFVIDLNTPTLNVTNALYDNTSGILTAYTSTPHNFSVGMGVSLSNLQFTCQGIGGINTYPSGKYGYIFEVKTVAPGRYVDSYNLIQNNKLEIQDKSLAAIALNHPDFIFPGNSSSDLRYRYYDSYRLIQKNKQEIVDKSLASIAVGFPSNFKFPDDPVPFERNRFYDASGLIQRNKQEIIDKSIGAIAIAHTNFYFPGDFQTNSRSRYFDSYRLIQKNKNVIVSIAWTNTVSVYPEISSTQNKCKRDLDFFVDAISADVLTGGNNYSREFTLQYFNNGSLIVNGLLGEQTQSNYAFNQVRNLMKNAVTNTLVGAAYSDLSITPDSLTGFNTSPNSCADVRSNIDNLVSIVTTSIGSGNTSSLPSPNFGYFVGIGSTSSPGGLKCARDLGFMIEAISTDIFTGGNKYSRDFTLQYFNNNSPISNGLLGEESQSITAFLSASEFAKKAVTNQLNIKNLGISSGPAIYNGPGIAYTVYASGNPDSCADVRSNIDNLVGIITTVIGAGSTVSLQIFNENLGISTTNICARDLSYLVDAISTDIFTGGNKYSRDFTDFYFNGASSVGIGTSERLQSVYAFNTLGTYAKKAITNQLNYKEIGISSGPANYNSGGPNIPVLPSGNSESCTDVQSAINTLVGIVTTVIGSGSQSFLNTFSENSGTFSLGISKCYRDIGYLIDALSLDVRDYTNENIRDFISGYFNANGVPILNGISGEVIESKTAFNAVRDYAKKAITNQLNYQDLTLQGDPTNKDVNSCANVQSFIDNLIATVNSDSVGIGTTQLSLPSVSMASTVFTCNVGVSTTPNQVYVSGGTARINTVRPFDGQVIYFGDLYYTVGNIQILNNGSGYITSPIIEIQEPDVSWGIPATSVAEIRNGSLTNIEIVSSGRGYKNVPKITISSPDVGVNTATAIVELIPTYYSILSSTPVSSGICTVTINQTLPYALNSGTRVDIYKQSRILASGHSLEYIGSGVNISSALPAGGGVPIQENETVSKNGGIVIYTTTDQSGNFRIGDGVVINQQTGTISGDFYSKSLFSTVTPFILALGGE